MTMKKEDRDYLIPFFTRIESEQRSRMIKRGLEARKLRIASQANEVVASVKGKGHVYYYCMENPIRFRGKLRLVGKTPIEKVNPVRN